MINRLQKQLIIMLTAIASLVVIGCKKSNTVNPDPVITSISALSGLAGSSVTITGNNFGTELARDTVKFNGVMATINSVSATSIVVTVPANAATGKISLITNGKTLVYPIDFKVTLPVPAVSDVVVLNISNGGSIIISGSNFNPEINKDTVKFNGITATVISASATRLIAQVNTKATTGNATVTVIAYGTTLTYSTNVNLRPYTQTYLSSAAIKYLAADVSGNLYGEWANAVLKISPSGTANTLATIGTGTTVLKGTAVDAAGNVYATGNSDHKIYKITAAGVVSTFAGSGVAAYADGQGTSAQFIAPTGMAIDASGNLFVCDSARIRKITPTGLVSTFAGSATAGNVDGQGQSATFSSLIAITADPDGNIFVINASGTIRKITPTGLVTTLNLQSGSTRSTDITAHGIADGTQIAADPFGNLFVCTNFSLLYGTQVANSYVRFPVYIINKSGFVTIFTEFNSPYWGIATDSSGNLYFSNILLQDVYEVWKYSF